jgi:NAD(P)-dependent dehydrogenase (short-subunit alcohol dehydrogenase family)
MDLHLTGKVVLITSGTDGLGAALADRLVEEGAQVAVCGRDRHRLAAAEQRLRDGGGDALVVQADVTSLADLERFVDAAVARWGRVDGLVNNAGKSAAGRIDEVSDDEWIADLTLKVLAAARCTRLTVPHLLAAGGAVTRRAVPSTVMVPPCGRIHWGRVWPNGTPMHTTASGLYRLMIPVTTSRCSARSRARSAAGGRRVKSDTGGRATRTASTAARMPRSPSARTINPTCRAGRSSSEVSRSRTPPSSTSGGMRTGRR